MRCSKLNPSRRTRVEAGALHTRGTCQGKAVKSLMGYAGESDDTSKEGKNANLKRHMHPNVHSSVTYNSQDMEAT